MKVSELQAQRKKLIDDAEALANKPGATAEELTQADTNLEQAEALQAQITQATSQEARLARINAGRQTLTVGATEPKTVALGQTGTILGRDEPTLPAIPKSYGQLQAFKGDDAGRQAYGFGAWALGLTNLACASHYRQRAQELGHTYQLAHAAGGAPSAGGFLVQESVGAVIQRLLLTYGVIRRFAEPVPMGMSEVVKSPIVTAGLRVYPAGENTERTASDMTFGSVELISRDWAVMSKFSNKINDLAVINLGDTLAKDMAYQFAAHEDDCCFNGDGSATYQGIHGIVKKINTSPYTASVFEAAAGNTAFATLDLLDFQKVTAKYPNFQGASPRWFISRAGFELSMQGLAIAAGMLSPTEGVAPRFLGYPVEFVEVLPTTGDAQVSTVVALFGDLSLAAKLGVREEFRLASSSERYFELDQTAIKAERSFGFNAYRLGSTTEAGPVIALKTPGA